MGITGPAIRPSISASVGLYLDLTRSWGLGPVIQYGQVFQPDGERYSTDARYFTFGVGVSMRPAPPEPPPRESPAMRMVRRQPPADDAPEPPAPIQEEPPPSAELMVLIDEAVEPLRIERISSSELLAPILFEHDSVHFIPCGEAALYEARDAIHAHPGKALLEGHADTTGEPDYNLALARRRAEAVRDWMVAHGVDPQKLEVTSSGECCQLEQETEDTPDERRQINRRVIVRLENPKTGSKTEPDSEPASASDSAPEPDSEPASASDSAPEPDSVPTPAPAPGSASASDSEPASDSESGSEPEPDTEPDSESAPEPAP
jgi:outer membrane protein OmpA-like peptidoglycan-associated protein